MTGRDLARRLVAGSRVDAWARRAVATLRGHRDGSEGLRALIAAHALGRTFADLGCMWNIHGAYAFHALACGASSVTAVDVMAPTPEFTARNHALGDGVRFLQADINDADFPARLGTVDVVFCTGVLYHMPNPLLTLRQLRRVCGSTLILGSITIPAVHGEQAAIFLPFLDRRARHALDIWPDTTVVKVGLDTEFGGYDDYANWFWGLTPGCVEAMARAAGFEIVERRLVPRAVRLVCRPTATG